jgi:hypothetical protein
LRSAPKATTTLEGIAGKIVQAYVVTGFQNSPKHTYMANKEKNNIPAK